MRIVETPLPGLVVLEPVVWSDNRGYFYESYNARVLEGLGLTFRSAQDNQSLSVDAGTLRGLHYQIAPRAQAKLVRVLSGALLDVTVDIRRGSPTYGRWAGVILSEANKRQLFVPAGFAHGVCTMEPNTQILYKVDDYYAPECDRGILWNDPELAITWPVTNPTLSERDTKLPLLRDAEHDFRFGG
jgi:dTDP-4-dehydrorhamnose 3,5-epimerase